jgi:hypothetical protein
LKTCDEARRGSAAATVTVTREIEAHPGAPQVAATALLRRKYLDSLKF